MDKMYTDVPYLKSWTYPEKHSTKTFVGEFYKAPAF